MVQELAVPKQDKHCIVSARTRTNLTVGAAKVERRLLSGQRGIGLIGVVLLVGGLLIAGVVVAAAVVLLNDIKITVENRSCGTIPIAAGLEQFDLNFIPGIKVPDEIPQGGKGVIRLPKRFVYKVTIQRGAIEVHAFGGSYQVSPPNVNMERTTWDGTAFSRLVGHDLNIAGAHTLVLECN